MTNLPVLAYVDTRYKLLYAKFGAKHLFGYSLVGSGQVDKAAIVSAAGDSVWAQSTGFDVCLTPPFILPRLTLCKRFSFPSTP